MKLNSSFFDGKRMGKVGEVSRELDVHTQTIYQWVKGGVPVPYYSVPGLGLFFDLDQVAAWYDKATDGRTHDVVYPQTYQSQPRPFPTHYEVPISPAADPRQGRPK